MALFEPEAMFFWTLYIHLFALNVVYSDSAHGELSFGTKTGSLGPCVLILLQNLGFWADFLAFNFFGF